MKKKIGAEFFGGLMIKMMEGFFVAGQKAGNYFLIIFLGVLHRGIVSQSFFAVCTYVFCSAHAFALLR